MSLLLTLTYFTPLSSVSIVNFDHAIADWVTITLSMVSLREKCPNKEFFSGPYLNTFYAVYVIYIFVLFKSSDHLKLIQIYLNSCQVNVYAEQNNKISFLYVSVIRE